MQDGNVSAMLETLLSLHAQLAAGPSTLREASFFQAFGHDLGEAHALLLRYQQRQHDLGAPIPTSGGFQGALPSARAEAAAGGGANGGGANGGESEGPLNAAWDLYYNVFRKINKQLPQLTTLDLQYVSPCLLGARSLELGVPGTYRVDKTAVRIAMFGPTVQVRGRRRGCREAV